MIQMAPVVSKKDWHCRGAWVVAKCPLCKQWLDVDSDIEQGFTTQKILCRMPQCYFEDFLRLEDYE